MIDREAMDKDIRDAVLETYPKQAGQKITPTKGEYRVYRAGYLAGMRHAAMLAENWTADDILAAADKLEDEK
jgi:hypothetical protein